MVVKRLLNALVRRISELSNMAFTVSVARLPVLLTAIS